MVLTKETEEARKWGSHLRLPQSRVHRILKRYLTPLIAMCVSTSQICTRIKCPCAIKYRNQSVLQFQGIWLLWALYGTGVLTHRQAIHSYTEVWGTEGKCRWRLVYPLQYQTSPWLQFWIKQNTMQEFTVSTSWAVRSKHDRLYALPNGRWKMLEKNKNQFSQCPKNSITSAMMDLYKKALATM